MIKVITQPTIEPVSLAEAKDHLRIYHNEEDTLIDSYVKAARQYAEKVLTWRAFIKQTIRYSLDGFPAGNLELPRPPLIEVDSVKYTKDGTETTLTADVDYTVETGFEPGYIIPANSWPSADKVTVEYKAGYGESADDVPLEFKQGLLYLIAHFYEMREPITLNLQPYKVPYAVEALLCADRDWGVKN